MLKDLRKLTIADDPPIPDLQTPGNIAYSQNQPGTTWARTVWFSHCDVCLFIDMALQAPLYISGTYFAMSNNHRLWVDLDDAKRDFGFVPHDAAEKL
ncbi:unnamed protein product [Rotaria sordida]|uniref:Uncharacterized protein n=1 Tax=Rotaria sordida TaxID=392033 RepID=A0A820JS52_9BILA|nr:unnamed protein product [Rotaria sordida]